MKILKHGNININGVITCNCGCEFEYEKSDIQCDICTIVGSTTGHKTYYLICPDCGAKIPLYYYSNYYFNSDSDNLSEIKCNLCGEFYTPT